MQARERELLAAHHGPLAADPWAAIAAETLPTPDDVG